MAERLVKFEVLGQEYPIYTDVPEEDIEEILQLVKSQLESQIRPTKGMLPANKTAVLATLNMAGEYVRLKRDFEHYRQSVKQCVDGLSSKIISSLAGEGPGPESAVDVDTRGVQED